MKIANFKKLIPERDQQKAVIEILEFAGFVVFRANTGVGRYQNKDGSYRSVRYGVPGFPDLFGWVHKDRPKIRSTPYPRPFFCEVKRGGKKPSKLQREFLDRAEADGCLCLVGTCENIEKQLKEKGYL